MWLPRIHTDLRRFLYKAASYERQQNPEDSRIWEEKEMAGRQGFEPRSGGPEPPVLPLDDLPALCAIVENWMAGFKSNVVLAAILDPTLPDPCGQKKWNFPRSATI